MSNNKFLVTYILINKYQHYINKINPLGYGGELINEFARLVKALRKGQDKEIYAADLKRIIDSKNTMFHGDNQHDSHEFLVYLLDGLHGDLNSGTLLNLVAQHVDSEASWNAYLVVNNSKIAKKFHGQLQSKVTCDDCHSPSMKFEMFTSLNLHLVIKDSGCTLGVSVSYVCVYVHVAVFAGLCQVVHCRGEFDRPMVVPQVQDQRQRQKEDRHL